MAKHNRIFIAFAIEDKTFRDLLQCANEEAVPILGLRVTSGAGNMGPPPEPSELAARKSFGGLGLGLATF